MKKLKLSPLNFLSAIGLLFGIFLFTKINSNNLFAVFFCQVAIVFTILLIMIDLILRYITKDFAKVILLETIFLAISIFAILGYFIFFK